MLMPFAAMLLLFTSQGMTVSADRINRPPHIFQTAVQRNILFKPGVPFVLPCNATGLPTPLYRWERNGDMYTYGPSSVDGSVEQLPNSGTLLFHNPSDKHEGLYQCFADNGNGISVSPIFRVQEAYIRKFVYAPRQIHQALTGSALTLDCVPPVSYPAAEITWVLEDTYGNLTGVHFDKRVVMDDEGRLHITSVQWSDEQGRKAYMCKATNPFTKESAIGPEHIIDELGVTVPERPPQELYTSPADMIVLKGGTLSLVCIFSGIPAPDVYWKKDNESLSHNARAVIKKFGSELQIENIAYSDAGSYRCMASNILAQLSLPLPSKQFQIRVESTPTWTMEPKSLTKRLGESATFLCDASGKPKPSIDWFINGIPLTDTMDHFIRRNPRVHADFPTNLTITDLTLDYHYGIQCNASNKHGYLWADFHLNTVDARPVAVG